MVDKVIKAILLLSPIVYIRSVAMNNFDLVILHISAMVLFVATFFDKPKRDFVGQKYIVYLLGIGLFSAAMHGFNLFIMDYLVNVFLAVVCLYVVIRYCRDIEGCFKFIVYAGIINILVWVVQVMGFSPVIPNYKYMETNGGIIGNAPRLSMYLSIISPFFIAMNKIWWVLLIPIPLIMREANILMALLLLFLLSDFRLNYKLWVIAFFAGAMFLFHDKLINSIASRITTYKEVLTGFFNHPVSGYGLGIYPYGQEMVNTKIDYAVYSSLLQFIVGAGMLSIPLVYETIKRYIKNFSRFPESLSLAILLMLCIGEYPLEIKRLWITIIMITGFFVIRRIDVAKQNCNS
ncbi:MAG: hypothetical protein HY761_09985 [Candidatus Omnitrophica bacterium]|nr:hypothetical protein [Candidatus Omnitrophota bacterium]